ncbi:O-antigen ligase family protein [Flavobacteriaceae bacterium]|nr:O-antigen ligase family protein [Flavobacteriaceae bacterium]
MKEKLLCLFALFLPLELILFYTFGIDTQFKPYRVFLILAFILTFIDKSIIHYKSNFIFKYILFIFTYGFSIAIIRIAFGEGELDYLTNGTTHFLIGLMIFYLFSNITSTKLLYKLGVYFLIGIFISSMFGLYNYFLGANQFFRLQGLFKNPNHLAFAVNFIMPFLFFKLENENRKFLNFILIIFFTVIVFLTGSRTGLLIQLFSLFFLIIIFLKKNLNFIFIVFIGIISVDFVVSNLLEINLNLLNRFNESSYETGSGRWDIIDAAMNLGVDTFFTGVGIGQYRFYHLDYISSTAYQTVLDFKLSTHNHFLDLLINYGFISFLLYVIIIITFFKTFFKKRGIQFYKYLLLILFILIVSSLSQEMFVFPLFWLMLALLTIPILNEKSLFK